MTTEEKLINAGFVAEFKGYYKFTLTNCVISYHTIDNKITIDDIADEVELKCSVDSAIEIARILAFEEKNNTLFELGFKPLESSNNTFRKHFHVGYVQYFVIEKQLNFYDRSGGIVLYYSKVEIDQIKSFIDNVVIY